MTREQVIERFDVLWQGRAGDYLCAKDPERIEYVELQPRRRKPDLDERELRASRRVTVGAAPWGR